MRNCIRVRLRQDAEVVQVVRTVYIFRYVSIKVFTCPQETMKFPHSHCVTLSSSFQISFPSSSMDRLAALRNSALSSEKNFSIGFKSGESGGR